MINIINDSGRTTLYDADNTYRNCNYLMTNIMPCGYTVDGNIYAVSDSLDTQSELLDIEDELRGRGISTLIGGEYRNSFTFDHLRMVRI